MDTQTTPKNQAMNIIRSLPDDCSMEDIQYHLYVREKVEAGIKAIDNEPLFTQEEAEKKVSEWLGSFGQPRR